MTSYSMQPVLLPPTNAPTSSTQPRTQPTTHIIITPDALMGMVAPVVNEELVASVDAVFVFHITGENGGTYYLDLKTGE